MCIERLSYAHGSSAWLPVADVKARRRGEAAPGGALQPARCGATASGRPPSGARAADGAAGHQAARAAGRHSGASPGAAPGAAARWGRAAVAAPPPAAAPARVRGRGLGATPARPTAPKRMLALTASRQAPHPCALSAPRAMATPCRALQPQTALTRRPGGSKLQARSADHPFNRRRGDSPMPSSAGGALAERTRLSQGRPLGRRALLPARGAGQQCGQQARVGRRGRGYAHVAARAPQSVGACASVWDQVYTKRQVNSSARAAQGGQLACKPPRRMTGP